MDEEPGGLQPMGPRVGTTAHSRACSGGLYDPLYFCGVSCNFSFFISNFIDLNSLFFLVESDQSFISFVYLLIRPTFSFIDLCFFVISIVFPLFLFLFYFYSLFSIFSLFYFIYFCLIVTIFFLLTLVFVAITLPLVALGVRWIVYVRFFFSKCGWGAVNVLAAFAGLAGVGSSLHCRSSDVCLFLPAFLQCRLVGW